MVAMMKEMKDSGIEWIGQIPEEWSLVPIRAVFKEVTDKNFDGSVKNALKFTYGAIVPKTNFEADNDDYVANTILNYTVVEPGTIVLNGLNLNYDFVSQRIGLVKNKGVITSAYMAFKPLGERVSPEYATYLFKAYDGCKALHNMGGGVRKILNFSEFKRYYVCFPTLLEQQAIVTYLDAKCAEIDALSTDIQSEIDTLEAYKRSVITEAVTKGLGKSAPVKDSGIPWIGMIPEHWKASKIKYEIFPVEKRTTERDGIITCFRDGEVTLRSKRREEGFTVSLTEHGYHGVDIGDLVIHGMDAFAGAIGCSDSRGKTTPVVHVCKTTGNNRFFMYCLRSMAYGNILMDLSDGIRVRSSDFRNFSKLGVFGIAVAPVQEQNEIVAYLDKICSEIESIIAQKQEQLAVLADYKKSVIYEYVTGKKEAPVI